MVCTLGCVSVKDAREGASEGSSSGEAGDCEEGNTAFPLALLVRIVVTTEMKAAWVFSKHRTSVITDNIK